MADDIYTRIAQSAPDAPPATGGGDVYSRIIESSGIEPTPQEYAERSARAGVSVGRSAEEQAGILRGRGFSESAVQQLLPHYRLGLAKSEEAKAPVDSIEQIGRKFIPYVSGVRNANKAQAYHDARERFASGKATAEDYRTIAHFEGLQEMDRRAQESTFGKVVHGVAGLPALVGEMYAGGKVVGAVAGRVGRALGYGLEAEGAAAARAAAIESGTPPLLAAIPEALARPGVLQQVGNHMGRMAVLTPISPSAWLEGAVERNLAAGRGAYDPEGFPAALGVGYANMVVLGSLQHYGGVASSTVGRLGAKAAIGLGEQQGADLLTGLVDEALPKWLQMTDREHRYGLLGKLSRGEFGKAGEDAVVQAFTFAAFAGMHEVHGRPGKAGEEPYAFGSLSEKELAAVRERLVVVPGAFADAVREVTGTGVTTPAAIDHLKRLTDRYHEAAAADEGLTRGEARELFEGAKGKVKDYLWTITEALSEKREEPATAPEKPAEATAPAAPPEAAAKPLEPVGAAPVPEVLSEAEIRRFAQASGIKATGGVGAILARFAKSPSAQARLDLLRQKKIAAGAAPPEAAAKPPEAAPAAPEAPAAPAKPAATGEFVHIASYKHTPKSVDDAVAMLNTRGFPAGAMDVWTDATHADANAQKGSVSFVIDRSKYGGEVAENRSEGVANVKGKVPLPYDPALGEIRYKGSEGDPQFARLKEAVDEVNAKRADAEIMEGLWGVKGLKPIELKATEKAAGEAEPDLVDRVRAEAALRGESTSALSGRSAEAIAKRLGVTADAVREAASRVPQREREEAGKANPFPVEPIPEAVRLRVLAERTLPPEEGSWSRRLDAPEADVPLDSLHATQPGVDPAYVGGLASGDRAGESGGAIDVLRTGGKNYIWEGHHRAAAAVARGEKTVRARFLDADAPAGKKTGLRGAAAKARSAGGRVTPVREKVEPAPKRPVEPETPESPEEPVVGRERAGRLEGETELERKERLFREEQDALPATEEHQNEKRVSDGLETRDAAMLKDLYAKVDAGEKDTPAMKQAVKDAIGGMSLRAAGAAHGFSQEGVRKASIRMLGESATKAIAKYGYDREKGLLYGPTAASAAEGGTGAAGAGAVGPAPSPAELLAGERKQFGLPNYPVNVPGRGATGAAYDPRAQAVVTGPMSAQNVATGLHEVGHHLATVGRFPFKDLPAAVERGLRKFNYVEGATGLTELQEGMAEWYKRRQIGELGEMTDDQRAANEFGENWLAVRGFAGRADRTKRGFAAYAARDARERFGALTSKTGEAALPGPGTKAERLKEYADEALSSQFRKKLDDLYDLVRAEKREADHRAAGGLPPLPEGSLPSEQFRANRYRAAAIVVELNQKGVFGYDKDGKQVILSKSLARIAKDHDLTPEELVNGGALDQYVHAKEAVWLAGKGRSNRPPEQVELARMALKEFHADPALLARMEGAAKDVTALFDATVEAMEMAGYVPAGTKDAFQKANPYYVPNTRVMDRETPKGFMKKRTGSGEEMVGLADAIADRLEYLAYVIPKQMKDKAFFNFFRPRPDAAPHGQDVLFLPMELTGKGKAEFDKLRAAGMEHLDAWEHLEASGEAAKEYFLPGSWPTDGRKPSYFMMVDGKPWRALIGSKPLHELLTGTQGEGEAVTKVASALAAVSTPIATLQRLGFTMLSPFYHVHNLMPWRDYATAMGRTVSEKGWIRDTLDYYKWQASSFAYYAAKLFGFKVDNPYFKLYDEMVGRNLDSHANLGMGSKKIVEGGWRGLYQRVTDAMGFGEKGSHVWEMKNVWDKAGYTEDRIRAELAADPSGATPIPFALQVAALNAAASVTHNYTTMGYQVRELNKSWPFLGVHVASAYKDLQTARSKPLLALRGLSILAAAKAIQWALYSGDEEYKQLSAHRRDGFILRTPAGYVYMPGPRGIQTPILGLMDESLRAASSSNPQFDTLLARSLEHTLPTGGPAGVLTGLEVLANRTRGGQEIVPKWDEGLPASEKFAKYQLPYAAEQLTGGLVPGRQVGGGGYDPLKSLTLPPQHESVTRLRGIVEDMKAESLSARRRGERYPDQRKYDRLETAAKQIDMLSVRLHKDAGATAADREEVNRRQVEIAKRALGAE